MIHALSIVNEKQSSQVRREVFVVRGEANCSSMNGQTWNQPSLSSFLRSSSLLRFVRSVSVYVCVCVCASEWVNE